MRHSLIAAFGLMSMVLTFATCSTDFELNQPQVTPVLYGVLDHTADTQWVKLNKSFLGGGDNYTYAAINDCTEYNNAVITVSEIGGTNRTWTLTETYVPVDNNSGIFYTDSQKVYYFVASGGLDNSASYDIEVEFDDNTPKVSASTEMIGNFDFTGLFKAKLFADLELETGSGLASPNYVSNFGVDWNLASDAKRYDFTIRFHYVEFNLAGDSVEKHIDWFQGTQKSVLTDGVGSMSHVVNGESFYQFVGQHDDLQDLTDIDKRVIKNVEFILTAGHDELNTYIEVNEPVTGVVTERPTYTNITNGIGLFSSKASVVLTRATPARDINLKRNSTEELSQGQYTGMLLFCSDSAAYVGEGYHCN